MSSQELAICLQGHLLTVCPTKVGLGGHRQAVHIAADIVLHGHSQTLAESACAGLTFAGTLNVLLAGSARRTLWFGDFGVGRNAFR